MSAVLGVSRRSGIAGNAGGLRKQGGAAGSLGAGSSGALLGDQKGTLPLQTLLPEFDIGTCENVSRVCLGGSWVPSLEEASLSCLCSSSTPGCTPPSVWEHLSVCHPLVYEPSTAHNT